MPCGMLRCRVPCSVKKTVSSRCYVCLVDPADIPAFKAAVEKQLFVTDRGTQYRGSVEFAPFQGVPAEKVKRDPREGSLHKGERLNHSSAVTL
jgi:regulator of nonsense transcripts 3